MSNLLKSSMTVRQSLGPKGAAVMAHSSVHRTQGINDLSSDTHITEEAAGAMGGDTVGQEKECSKTWSSSQKRSIARKRRLMQKGLVRILNSVVKLHQKQQ
jgi:hypothetical protein